MVAGLGFEPRMAKAYETSLVTRPSPRYKDGLLTQMTLNELLIAIFHSILVTHYLSHCTPCVMVKLVSGEGFELSLFLVPNEVP